jgi:hypothetical protein
MNRRGRILVYCILFLSVFFHPLAWGENKNIQIKGEILKKEALRGKKERYEEFLSRIQGDVKRTLEQKISRHSMRPELAHIDPDYSFRAPQDEKVVFTQNINLEKKKIKTRLDVKLGRTRKVTQISKEISFDKWKVRYHYNAQKKIHSFNGDAKIAGFDAHLVINSKQKPALSVRRPIKISESVKVVPSGMCNFENKNYSLGLAGNVDKYFTGTIFVNKSPGFRKMEYSLKGSVHKTVDIRLHGRTVCNPINPKANRATHHGSIAKKLGKHVSVKVGFQYKNSTISNPSFTFVYSRKF